MYKRLFNTSKSFFHTETHLQTGGRARQTVSKGSLGLVRATFIRKNPILTIKLLSHLDVSPFNSFRERSKKPSCSKIVRVLSFSSPAMFPIAQKIELTKDGSVLFLAIAAILGTTPVSKSLLVCSLVSDARFVTHQSASSYFGMFFRVMSK